MGSTTRSRELDDLTVLNTLPDPAAQVGGWGIAAHDAVVDVFGAWLSGNTEFQALAVTDGTLVLRQVVIEDGESNPCQGNPDCPIVAGTGAGSFAGGLLDLADFAVFGHASAGIQVGPTGFVSATDGVVTRNRIGVNVENAQVDVDVNFTNVRVTENVVDLDTSDLRPPSIEEVLGDLF